MAALSLPGREEVFAFAPRRPVSPCGARTRSLGGAGTAFWPPTAWYPYLATRLHAAAALTDGPVSGATFMKSLLDLFSSSLVLFFIFFFLFAAL